MAHSADSTVYDEDQNSVANGQESGILKRLTNLEREAEAIQGSIKAIQGPLKSLPRLEASHRTYLSVRQRTLSTWARDAYKRDQDQNQKRHVNGEEIIFGDLHVARALSMGDVRTDALLVIERFHPASSERQLFAVLYGLEAEAVRGLGRYRYVWYSLDKFQVADKLFDIIDEEKCPDSLYLLDTGAGILLDKGWKELPEDMRKDRDAVVALLESREYEEAEQLSCAIVWD